MITRQILLRRQLVGLSSQLGLRSFSSSPARTTSAPATKPHTIDPKWLTMVKTRLGKCLSFGLRPDQIQAAGSILQQLARDWRELVAGSEGYLTDETRRGLFRHNVVWGEMDVMGTFAIRINFIQSSQIHLTRSAGHVNNVTYVRYAETARINWSRKLAHIDPGHKHEWLNIVNSTGIGLILKSIKVDYKFPMKWPDKISVYHKLAHNPASASGSAFELLVMIVSEARQRPAARCHEDIVTYDYKLGRKTPSLPPFMVEQFKRIWEQQEEAKRTWQQRILDIENQVRRLELASWDREGDIEDMGSARR